ncbi:S8 family peptidase [Variovorax beijingensis]|nr:S8 family peptidase [Variovorax beijingensis]
MPERPLLVFPVARRIEPEAGRPRPSSKPHFPERGRQVERLGPQLASFREEFQRYSASIQRTVDGLEPETVLVIEIAGSVKDFKQAVDSTEGLEWLGEWDAEVEADDDFYEVNDRGERRQVPVSGRLFISMVSEAGMRELLGLWDMWQRGQALPRRRTKWRDVFAQTRVIRRWGIQETLDETGMLERWRELVEPLDNDSIVACQIELFYRQRPERRRGNEDAIRRLTAELDGVPLGGFIDMAPINFHAVKVGLPAGRVRDLIGALDAGQVDVDAQLFNFQGVMYFRPTGQAIPSDGQATPEEVAFEAAEEVAPPVVAILDGVPSIQHAALRGRVQLDDAFDLARLYQTGERRHGSSMASLIIHGEQPGGGSALSRQIYHIPVLQPDEYARGFGHRREHVPDTAFLEDRIERAVRRMLEGDGDLEPQAPGVKIINLSIGDPDRPFIRSPSPLARLLDYLAWRYKVLFCVSAGNYTGPIDLGMTHVAFSLLPPAERHATVVRAISNQLSARRLLAPAEALNVITVGALHTDESGAYVPGLRADLIDQPNVFSPATRFGHGFRRSMKPEVFLPGGRQLYDTPLVAGHSYIPSLQFRAPGQRVAFDSDAPGELSHTVYTRGTSNAAALATRAAAVVHEALAELRTVDGRPLPADKASVVIKALLVHGARHDEGTAGLLRASLRTPANGRKFREITGRYLGYGALDIQRVLECTEQRGTLVACDDISENEIHEYRLPVPVELSASSLWRRLVVTLAWFSPMNFAHRNLREARLGVQPLGKWEEVPLRLGRVNADHNQVLRGTVQHEVLEANDLIAAIVDGDTLTLRVTCKADATARLDEQIPYALAITLEVSEGVAVPIYTRLREGIRQQVRVAA